MGIVAGIGLWVILGQSNLDAMSPTRLIVCGGLAVLVIVGLLFEFLDDRRPGGD